MSERITPSAFEHAVSFKFYGADDGAFPASTTSTALTGQKLNSLKFNGAEETKDFSAGQDLMALERIVKQASSVSGQLNLKSVSSFLQKYQSEGPLCEVTITQDDPGDTGTEMSLVFKGLMKLPDISFLDNPGVIDFEVRPYGEVPLITFPS